MTLCTTKISKLQRLAHPNFIRILAASSGPFVLKTAAGDFLLPSSIQSLFVEWQLYSLNSLSNFCNDIQRSSAFCRSCSGAACWLDPDLRCGRNPCHENSYCNKSLKEQRFFFKRVINFKNCSSSCPILGKPWSFPKCDRRTGTVVEVTQFINLYI